MRVGIIFGRVYTVVGVAACSSKVFVVSMRVLTRSAIQTNFLFPIEKWSLVVHKSASAQTFIGRQAVTYPPRGYSLDFVPLIRTDSRLVSTTIRRR